MKKILIIFALIYFIRHQGISMHRANKNKSLKQDTLIISLGTLNLSNFYDKPIDSLIAKIPQNFQSMKVLGGSKDDRAGKLLVSYNSNVYIVIRVREFTHLDPTNPDKVLPEQRWSTTLMRKEKIYSIKIYNGNTLINHFNEDY